MQCGGSEKVISKLANYLAKEGHNISIITTDREEPSYFELDLKIKRIGILKGTHGSKFLSIPRKFTSILKLRRVIRKEQPDMVLAFQERTAIFTLLSLLGTKLFKVVAIRNHPEFKKLGKVMTFLRKRLYRNADVLVTQTEGIAHWIRINLGLDSEVIPNPVEDVQIANDISLEKAIYACGRIETQKGFHTLLSIFENLSKECSGWTLNFLGDGKEKIKLQQKVKTSGLENKVIFKGRVKSPFEYYQKGGIYAFTSEYEGYPNALCEAMASGMAVVSFDCPSGPSDLIEDGVNGFLIKLGDNEAFKNRLKQLIRDKELRFKLGNEAKKIKDRLAIERIAEKWLSLKAEGRRRKN